MHKQRDSDGGKLIMGPIWDFNLGFGNANYCTSGEPEGFVFNFNSVCPDDSWLIPFWWKRLLQDRSFKQRLHERWQELRKDVLKTSNIHSTVDSISTLLDESQQRNFQRWNVLGNWVWPNYWVGDSFEEEVAWLKEWIEKRTLWLDKQFGDIVSGSDDEDNVGLVVPNPIAENLLVKYRLKNPGTADFTLYDLQGQVRARYGNAHSAAGNYEAMLGDGLSSGFYLLKYSLEGTSGIIKVVKD